MSFTPRTYEQILDDMVAYCQVHTEISDYTPGSVSRSILEAAALEDDEQYFQMVQLLDSFSIFSAKGEVLDRRLSDFNIARIGAKAATGRVRFFDDGLLVNKVAIDAAAGDSIVYVFDSTHFPTSGYPYIIRLGEGTTRSQDVTVTGNATTTGAFTLSTVLTFPAALGDRCALVTGAVAHTISAGQLVQVPATNVSVAQIYSTQEQAFITAGNYYSNTVVSKATTVGSASNIGAGRVTRFVGSPPFTGANVVSVTVMAGGADEESDDELVARGVLKIASLSKGTPLALKSASLGVEDSTTGQRVLSSNLIEDFIGGEVKLYIDDGTGLTAETASMPTSTLTGTPSAGVVSLTLSDATSFPTAGKLLIIDGANTELVPYRSKTGVNTLALSSATVNNHVSTPPTVYFVELVSESTEEEQRRFKLRAIPLVRSSDHIYKKEGGTWAVTPLVNGVDYDLNRGTGDLVLVTALAADSTIVSSHQYYINLVATVQKVLEGDPDDETNFPGYKAAGIKLSVETPDIRRITVVMSITAKPGYLESDLYASVRSAVERYITSLKLGNDVVVSKIIAAAQNIAGVASVRVSTPNQDVVVLENQLPSPYDSNGTSQVTIS